MQQPNRRRLLTGRRGYTVGTVILLYVCLLVWLYVAYPAVLGAILIVGMGIIVVGAVERLRSSDTRGHDPSTNT